MEEEARSGIINGVMTVPHSWPWQVSIQGQDDSHYCGASLLSPAQHRSEESQLRPGSHTANTSCPLTDCHADFRQIVIWLTEAF